MTKRIVNKAERNAERYDAKETGYKLYSDSQDGKIFDRLMPLVLSEQNIILAYRNICKNGGSKTPGTDGKTITDIQRLTIDEVIERVRNKLRYYQPKKVQRVEIPKDNGKKRPLGIPSIWDKLIQQCILQILEPICEAKFHERNNGFRPYRSTENAIAQCYKMAQIQHLHYVVDVDIVGFFDNINHSKLIRQLWSMGIRDRKLIMIVKQMLKAEILFNDIVITPETGTPQGGILSPLLANVVLNELDWWVAKQWEVFKIREGVSGLEFPKRDKEGNVYTVDMAQKWKKMRKTTELKEMYIVRYADDFKIFCRDYAAAKKTMEATKKWLSENLHLDTSDEKSGITNLRKNYTTFLGIKFKVVPKGEKWVIKSRIADKSAKKVTQKLQAAWGDIKNPSNANDINRYVDRFNAMVVGMHNYYAMATHVSGDFSKIAFKAVGKSNGMNHNGKFLTLEKHGEFTSLFLKDRYGKSKRCRWIKGRVIVPVGYVQHVYPKYKRRDVSKYIPKYTDNQNCISFAIMKYMMENAEQFPTLEMADNALSRYIAQKGKCAILHVELTLSDMVCLHIKHPKGERNDTYKNLIIVSKDMAKLIKATTEKTVREILREYKLTTEMQEKINKLRAHRELESIQF